MLISRIISTDDGAKDFFYISDVDDREYLVNLIKASIPSLTKICREGKQNIFGLLPMNIGGSIRQHSKGSNHHYIK